MSATSIEFKGGGFTLSVLALSGSDLAALQLQLQQHIQRAPKLFAQMPVVLDLKQLCKSVAIEALVAMARQLGLAPIAISGACDSHQLQAKQCGLAQFRSNKSISSNPHSQIIDRPVRSGQQIYAEGADLIVTSSVGAGAEIVADGNIIVFGPMRGRAFAGASGRADARIICHRQQAELISIAGHYQVTDQLPTELMNNGVMHRLEHQRFVHQPLNLI